MLERIKNYQSVIILWSVVLFSIGFNVYLVLTQPEFDFPDYQDAMLDSTDADQQLAEVAADSTLPLAENQPLQPSIKVVAHSVTAKESLKAVLVKNGVLRDNIAIIEKTLVKQASNILKAGDKLFLELEVSDASTKVKKLTIDKVDEKIVLAYNDKSQRFEAKKIIAPIEHHTKLISGYINGSIYSSARKAGADQQLIREFINLLSHNVDFQRDVRAGDYFRIYYEYATTSSKKAAKKAQILYASLTANGEEKEVFRYKLPSGKTDYFDSNGQSVRKSLLRTPINGARISSQYGMRNHPVHGYSKMHQGVDFSAPRGTPILAAGDGVIAKVSSHGRGYGNFVQVEHNKSFSTLYAHMSKFATGIRPGSAVKQGQVIGYVGATGTATGPHLHYEVIHNGSKVNPSKANFPKTNPLNGVELAKFKKALLGVETLVASSDSNNVRKYAANEVKNKTKKTKKNI